LAADRRQDLIPPNQLTDLIRAITDEVMRRIAKYLLGLTQVTVVSVATGPPVVVTYKRYATDTNTYTARIIDGATTPSAGDNVWLLTLAGDAICIGRLK
jgi:hypothetical protein